MRGNVEPETARRHGPSIRLRLALVTAAVVAAVLLISGWALLVVLDDRLDRDVDEALTLRLDAAVSVVSVQGVGGLDRLAAPSGVLPGSLRLNQVFAPDGSLLASQPSESAPVLSPTVVRGVGTTGWIGTVTVNAEPVTVRARAVRLPDGRRAVVAVGASLTLNRNAIANLRMLLLALWLPASALAGAGGWLVAGSALRPVEAVRRRADDLTLSSAADGLPIPASGDEIERLARTLDGLVRRLHRALEDRRAQYVEHAHDLRTPVTALCAELELLELPAGSDDASREGLRSARQSAQRLSELIERQLVLAVDGQGSLLRLAVTESATLVTESVGRHRRQAVDAGVSLRTEPFDPELCPLVCDPVRVGQILDNLIDNSLAACAVGGQVTVGVRAADDVRRRPPALVFQVIDTGPGFPAGVAVFARYVRGADQDRSRPEGMGLGLAIVRALVAAHDGSCEAGDRPGGGAWVRVTLPTAGPGALLPGSSQPGASARPTNRS